jgi:diguanylate cyclase (GGDEF)-like protein
VAFSPRDRTLAQLLSRAFALLAGLGVGAFAMTLLAYAVNLGWVTPQLDRSRLSAKAESAAFAAMLDEENGLRAYLLTHESRFLAPYKQATIALDRANGELLASLDSADVGAQMVRVRVAEEKWHERWADAVIGPLGDAPPAMEMGKELFDAYRSEQSAFAQAIDRRTETLSRRERGSTEVRVALELAVFLGVLVLAIRQHRALRESVVAPLAELLRDIARVRDGVLETTVEHRGPRELRELRQGINDMVHALSAAQAVAEARDDLVREHAARLRQILNASREFAESLNLSYVVSAVRASTAAVGGYERVIVWLTDDEEKKLRNAEAMEGAERGMATMPPEAIVEMGEGLAGRAAKCGRITVEDSEGRVRFKDSENGSVRALAIPLIVGARVVGVLEARHAQAQVPTNQAAEILEMFATHAATAIEAARLHEVTEERSQMDPLTHLFNRRRLEEDLNAEWKRCARYGRPLTFVMLDVDYFKAFNDTHGHPQADLALQELASVIASAIRASDTPYRYGGEEFCILLRETNAEDGLVFAERLRKRVEQRFASGRLPALTTSLGVAEFSANMATPLDLVEAADAAMYESKAAGRNRVTVSSAPPARPFGLPRGEIEPPLSS